MARSPRAVDLSSRRGSVGEQPQGLSMMESRPDPERIAQRAYERFEARGREDGRDLDDWLEAERELNGLSANATVGEQKHDNPGEAA